VRDNVFLTYKYVYICCIFYATFLLTVDSRRFRRQNVAEIGDYSLQREQAIRLPDSDS